MGNLTLKIIEDFRLIYSLFIQGLLANGTLPVNLQQLEQEIVPYSECLNYWEGHITSRMFCVTSYFYDSCNGKKNCDVYFRTRLMMKIYFISQCSQATADQQ